LRELLWWDQYQHLIKDPQIWGGNKPSNIYTLWKLFLYNANNDMVKKGKAILVTGRGGP
jgi:hypothetical protein